MSRSEAEPPSAGPSLEAVIAAHQTPLLRYALRIVRDEESAQDVVQETFMRYLKAPPSEGNPKQLSAWLFRVAHNLCVDLIRKESRMRESCEQIEIPAHDPPASDGFVAEETSRQLGELLARLTENQRTVIVLKFQEKKSYREISEITGLTVTNVGFLIHRGLKKMAEFARKEELL